MAHQLRVRIPEEQRKFLEDLTKSRNRGENLSDIVRMIISDASRRGNIANAADIALSPVTQEILAELARELDRKPKDILEDCVRGIQAVIEGDNRPPLIAEEVRLRRRYRNLAKGMTSENRA